MQLRFAALVATSILLLPVQVHSTPRPAPAVHHQTLHAIRMTAADWADLRFQALAGELKEIIAERDQVDAQNALLKAQLSDLQGQVDSLKSQLEARSGGLGGSAGGNHFPFGQCTYYVAARRPVPWFGNAIAWLSGARAFGFPTGSAPRAGAIMVSAESYFGHVAYVEQVNGDGSFVVSEMNWSAWGVVDWRTVWPGRVPVLGYIY